LVVYAPINIGIKLWSLYCPIQIRPA